MTCLSDLRRDHLEMEYFNAVLENVKIDVSAFSKNNVGEIHLFATSDSRKHFDGQLEDILQALARYLRENSIPAGSVVFTRYFVSDYANHAEVLNAVESYSRAEFKGCAVSIVQQPPMGNRKIAVWAYVINDRNREVYKAKPVSSSELILRRGDYEHIWSTQLVTDNGSTKSSDQTNAVFARLNHNLKQKGYSLKDNCIRTWLFVRDIDLNYPGVVEARKNFFEKFNMTKDTHFIASTGIEGRHAHPGINVLMDAYSVGGVSRDQIRFLEAREYLNPTYEYGVTFERGTSLDFGDRRHIYISGTASIDHRGEVVHRKDVSRQIERTFTNISALLADAGATMEDVAQMIVYLRDPADTETVDAYLENNYRNIPKIVVLAPVCRPEWLVEIECIAIKESVNAAYADF